jgi:hypothetical protein
LFALFFFFFFFFYFKNKDIYICKKKKKKKAIQKKTKQKKKQKLLSLHPIRKKIHKNHTASNQKFFKGHKIAQKKSNPISKHKNSGKKNLTKKTSQDHPEKKTKTKTKTKPIIRIFEHTPKKKKTHQKNKKNGDKKNPPTKKGHKITHHIQ